MQELHERTTPPQAILRGVIIHKLKLPQAMAVRVNSITLELPGGKESAYILARIGGAERDRTADLLVANEALSQLSYSPTLQIATVSRSDSATTLV